MNPAEYDRMYALENHYWWFVARRRLALGLLQDFGLRIADCGLAGPHAEARRRDDLQSLEEPAPASATDATSVSAVRSDGTGISNLKSEISEIRAATPDRLPEAIHPQSAIRNPQSAIVLDLGCGTGAVLQELDQQATAVGVDMSSAALAYCRKRGLQRLTVGRGEALPVQTGSVQAVVALDVFEHIEDDGSALKEAHRVLAPGGVLVLSVPAFKSLWGPHDVALMHFRRYRKRELREKLLAAGFLIEKLSYSVFFLFPVVWVFRLFEKRKRGRAEASLPQVPVWLNRALIGLQSFEAKLIGMMSLPWGSSLVGVARKPRA